MKKLFTLTLLGLFTLAIPALAAPNVVVGIKPVHSIASSILDNVSEPHLLVDGAQSPHTYSLKPSDAKKLEQADAIFWIGEDVESFLEKPLSSLPKNAKVVKLMDGKELKLLKNREQKGGDHHDEHDHHDHGHGHHHDSEYDPHIWLSPDNAIAMARHITDVVSEIDPENQKRYAGNLRSFVEKVHALDKKLKADLAPVQDKAFITFHDAYQYFDTHYGLKAVGTVTLDTHQKPGAKRIQEIRHTITDYKATCIFQEPQFSPAVISSITEGLDIKTGTLDPLGADLKNGKDLYFKLLENMSKSLTSCLSA